MICRRLAAPLALWAALALPVVSVAQEGPPPPQDAPQALVDVPAVPAPRSPTADECKEPVDLVPGRPLPAGLVDARGVVLCRATVVPTSELAYLLDRDTWADQVAPRLALGRLELQRLELTTEWERERANRLQAALDKPPPFWHRPGTQRVVGAVEALLMVVVVGAILVNTDTLQINH